VFIIIFLLNLYNYLLHKYLFCFNPLNNRNLNTPREINFRIADFGVKKSGPRVGKGRGMFDEGFWESYYLD